MRFLRFIVPTILFALASLVMPAVDAQQTSITAKDLLNGLGNPARWLTYSGDYSGRRHSPLTQITPANAGQLSAQWTFQTGVAGKFEATPIVIDGTLYVSGALNHAWAIDAATGKQLWHYQRLLPQPIRACCGLVNRGLAVYGDRLYMSTLDAHLVALDRQTGKVVFDVESANWEHGYAATAAPLIVKDKVIVGIAGGEFGIRGFIDAHDPTSGARIWRFWTVPAAGEPGSETWPADVWQRGGGPTWLTGSYDPESNLLFWGTGNPSPDYDGSERGGDNLYTGSLVALDADTGKLKWHYQFTPHDVHDWDANQIPVLADITIGGRARKVVMLANRNGFFYVLDRANGEVILAKPFVNQTWAKEIGRDGRPVVLPESMPTDKGTRTCPDLFGGTNFMSPSYDPSARLFFVTARETCMTFFSQKNEFKQGSMYMGGSIRPTTDRRYGALRAIDPTTGERKWEFEHATPSWAGVLSTAGGVVFTGDNEGVALAFESRTGKRLWSYQTGSALYASPATYMVGDRQHVLVPAGMTLTAFALPAKAGG